MSNYEVLEKDGPSEATLAHATDRRGPVVFRVEEGVLEARLDAVEGLRALRNCEGPTTLGPMPSAARGARHFDFHRHAGAGVLGVRKRLHRLHDLVCSDRVDALGVEGDQREARFVEVPVLFGPGDVPVNCAQRVLVDRLHRSRLVEN
jgi:hypothetical protein